jgi:putative FmdB family regulatory protein
MPLYEYQCLECGKRTEVLQSMHDAPLTTCAECNGPLKKLISSPAFQFKGSGWYVTDYARGSGGKDKDGGGKGSDGGEGGSESMSSDKTDNKTGGESSSGTKSAKETPAAPAPKASSTSEKD